MSEKKVKRTRPLGFEWMQLSFEELGKTEVHPGLTLESFYEEFVRKKCGKDFARREMMRWEATGFAMTDQEGELRKTRGPSRPLSYKKERHEPFTVTWLARQAGMDRDMFNRKILPKIKRYDELRSQKYGSTGGGLLKELGKDD